MYKLQVQTSTLQGGDFPVAPTPDWKVRRTGRLESLPHICFSEESHVSQFRNSRLEAVTFFVWLLPMIWMTWICLPLPRSLRCVL